MSEMGEIYVVAEHRLGRVRDITFEMLYKAAQLGEQAGHRVTAVVLAGPGAGLAEQVAPRADAVLSLEDERLGGFNNDLYKEILWRLLQEKKPLLTLIGHTSWGLSYAPSLAVRSGWPLASDCVDILLEGDRPKAVRQIYGGKVFSRVRFQEAAGYLATVRPGAFTPPEELEPRAGEIVPLAIPDDLPAPRMTSLELKETGAGAVDITQADLLVSVGRGISEEENIAAAGELAELLGGTLSCSRPIVDKNWLPKYHQVGTSGKSVRPKVYLALGISGAFQHVAGISGARTVIAVNKDRKAPIFRVAHYGVVEDLFKVLEAMKEKIRRGKDYGARITQRGHQVSGIGVDGGRTAE